MRPRRENDGCMDVMRMLKRHLPHRLLLELRQRRYAYQIRRNTFKSPEKEFGLLASLIQRGDNVIDIGANVGHYTVLMSKLVGNAGIVFAFEPVPTTFGMQTHNVVAAKANNVTLLNLAVTSQCGTLRFDIPDENPYLAHISQSGDLILWGAPLDTIVAPSLPVSFMKVDAEGHDTTVIESARRIIEEHRPILMAELRGHEAEETVATLRDYVVRWLAGSHNSFFVPIERCGQVAEAFPE